MPTTRSLSGAALILLMGCGAEQKAETETRADSEPASVTTSASPSKLLLCGADTISVQGAPADTLQLNVYGESFVVALVPSASGARYQAAADTGTFFWNHGDRALVQIRGLALPECEVLP